MMMSDPTTVELAEIKQRLEDFDPATATFYGPGDDVPADLALIRAQAVRAMHERRAVRLVEAVLDL